MAGFSGQVSATHDYKLGITFASKLSPWGRSFVVLEVKPSGIGAKSGLKEGDIIVSYDSHKFTKWAEYHEWTEAFTQSLINRGCHNCATIEIIRSELEMTLTVDNRTDEEIQKDSLEDRVAELEGGFKDRGEKILSQVKDDYSNLSMLDMKLEFLEEEYAEFLSSLSDLKDTYDGLMITVKSFEKESKMMALNVLSRIAGDFSNLEKIAQEIVTLQKRSISEKEYISLEKQVKNLKGDFKKQSVSLLSEIADDLSNLDEVRGQIVIVVNQSRKDSENKEKFKSLREEVSELEGDFKKQAKRILIEINDDFSNLEEIESQIQEISAKSIEYKGRRDRFESLKLQVAGLDENSRSQGESLLADITDDFSNLDVVGSRIQEIIAENLQYRIDKSKAYSLKQEVAKLEDDFRTQGEAILLQVNDDFSNVDSIESQIAELSVRNNEWLAVEKKNQEEEAKRLAEEQRKEKERLAEEKRKKAEEARKEKERLAKEQRKLELEKIALNPGFKGLKPGLTRNEIRLMKVCFPELSSGNSSTCYDRDNMKFQGEFRSGILRVLRLDMGPVVQSQTFFGRVAEHVGDGDIVIDMRRALDKYEMDYQYSERDRQLFNEGEKDKLYMVYEKGQVALLLTHIKKSTYDIDNHLFVEYRDPETAKKFLQDNRPKKAKSSDF